MDIDCNALTTDNRIRRELCVARIVEFPAQKAEYPEFDPLGRVNFNRYLPMFCALSSLARPTVRLLGLRKCLNQ
jgi:hypothetical protein